MKYYAIHTHLHCSHEPTASIGSHMSHCKSLGIGYMWTTEHDTRMGKKKKNLPFFSFNKDELVVDFDNGVWAGFKEEENNTGKYEFQQTEKGFDLRIIADKGEEERLIFYSKGKAHSDPLFSRITVELDADISMDGGQVCVEFIFSAQPPTYRQARLCYMFGIYPTNQTEDLVQYMSFPNKENGVYTFAVDWIMLYVTFVCLFLTERN